MSMLALIADNPKLVMLCMLIGIIITLSHLGRARTPAA
jgi:hypothetical protein